jgi:hypothetical protein
MSASLPHSVATPPGSPAPTLTDPEGLFRRNYNRKTFCFPHGLSANPLFDLDNLIELSKRMPDHRDTYWSNGKVAVGNGWEAGTGGRMSLQDSIANIAANDSIVILKHTEQDPVYGPVLQDFLGKVVDLAGEQMRSDVTVGEALILISSPNRVTPYHMDGETNFLVQVRGDKWFYVFDHEDRSLVTHEERERYFSGDISAIPYREEHQKNAVAYDLKEGYGVHVPLCAPHWVQNRDNVSVAISITYELRSVERLTRIHRTNRRLRRLGFNPTPPGKSALGDQLKVAAARAFSGLRAMRGGPKEAPRTYNVWTPPAK